MINSFAISLVLYHFLKNKLMKFDFVHQTISYQEVWQEVCIIVSGTILFPHILLSFDGTF